jgi:hypothetical protein
MKTITYSTILISSLLLLNGCGGGGSGGSDSNSSNSPQVYSTSVTAVRIARSADLQAITVGGLPAKGAEIVVE